MTVKMLVEFFAQLGHSCTESQIRKAIRTVETTIHKKIGRRDGRGGVFYIDDDVDCIAHALGFSIPEGSVYKR